MDQDPILKIAAEVAKQLFAAPWKLIAIQAVIMLLAAAVGAFLGEHLRTRGKSLATKADVASVLRQLITNTRVVEAIKSEVSQKDWSRREWANLRRAKLEELLKVAHECEDFRKLYRANCMEGVHTRERDPDCELETIAALYFPELKAEVDAYLNAHRTVISDANNLALALLKTGTDADASQKLYDDFSVNLKSGNNVVLLTGWRLNSAARQLLVQIMDVTDLPQARAEA